MIGDRRDPNAGLADRHLADRVFDGDAVKAVALGDLGREILHSVGGQRFGRLVAQRDQVAVFGMSLGTGDALEGAGGSTSIGIEVPVIRRGARGQGSRNDPGVNDGITGG